MSDYENEVQEDLNTYEQDQDTEDQEQQAEEQDRLANLQKEFERKLQNTTAQTNKQLQALADAQNQLLAQLSSVSSSKASQAEDDDMESLMYSDPKAYAAKIEERATKKAMESIQKSTETQNQQRYALQSAINEVVAQFPELGKSDHPMTQRVYDIVGTDPSRIDPKDIKLAALQVATEMNIAPISKRNKQMKNDDFSGLPSSSSKSKPKRSKNELSEGTKAWAVALGLDLRDPVTVKRLQARSKRDWLKPSAISRDLNKDLED